MGRTALHYAVSMKGEGAEAIVKLLTEAKSDTSRTDLSGRDIDGTKANPIDMDEFMKNYQDILDRNLASVGTYTVVLSSVRVPVLLLAAELGV